MKHLLKKYQNSVPYNKKLNRKWIKKGESSSEPETSSEPEENKELE